MCVVHEIEFSEASQENIAKVKDDKFQTMALFKDGERNEISKVYRVKKGG